MKAFLAACVAAVVIALGSSVLLNSVQKPVAKAFSTESVRLG